MPFFISLAFANLVLLHNHGDVPAESRAPQTLRLARVVALLVLNSIGFNLGIHGDDRLNLSFNREDDAWVLAGACNLCQLSQDWKELLYVSFSEHFCEWVSLEVIIYY